MKTILSVDLGGTKILIGEVCTDGTVLSSRRYSSTVTSQREALSRITGCIKDFLKKEPLQGEVLAIGIGVVGRVDRSRGIWLEIHPELAEPLDVAAEIRQEFGYPCYISNDVNCATLAEKLLGMGKLTDDFIYLNIGTGIAAGFVVNGEILEGSSYDAGEVGHMVVDFKSDVSCPCGRSGCLEVLASGLGMHNRAAALMNKYPNTLIKKQRERRITSNELFEGYEKGDPLCVDLINDALDAASTAVMNLIRVTDPEAVVLGGGVVNSGWFIEKMLPKLVPKTIRFVTKGIAKTTLNPSTIGLQGAGLMAFSSLEQQSVPERKGA